MANCNDLFQKFLSEITISSSKSENLKRGKDSIEEEIKNYFTETMDYKQPDFFLQGSYVLKILINPLNPEDEYDLDDGIHLQHLSDEISEWPNPQSLGNLIINAVEELTETPPEKKPNCVRIIYANDYHIDLPIYCENNGIIYLASLKKNKWIKSDPKTFKDWFYNRLEKYEQMRSCIKYLKAWKDFRDCELKGIQITVLVGWNHYAIQDRDDESILQTIENILSYLKTYRAIYNPVDPEENMISNWNDSKIDAVIENIENFHSRAAKAVTEHSKIASSKIWRSLFGDRFPLEDTDERGTIINGPKHREISSSTQPWKKL